MTHTQTHRHTHTVMRSCHCMCLVVNTRITLTPRARAWRMCSVGGDWVHGVTYPVVVPVYRERPYHAERTGSHSNAEVKLCRARLVLARGTSWEP